MTSLFVKETRKREHDRIFPPILKILLDAVNLCKLLVFLTFKIQFQKLSIRLIEEFNMTNFDNNIMRQSIPVVPPPPGGSSQAFAHVLIPVVGRLKFYHCPGVGHLPTPGTTPGHLTPLSDFGPARNTWILKLSKMITFVKLFYVFGRLLNTDHVFSVLR